MTITIPSKQWNGNLTKLRGLLDDFRLEFESADYISGLTIIRIYDTDTGTITAKDFLCELIEKRISFNFVAQ